MSLEQWSILAQVAGSIGVFVSLIFVDFQIKQKSGAAHRNEHDSTMAQWTVIRQAIATNRDVAELLTAGPLLSGVLTTKRGDAWWRADKHRGLIPGFVVDVDAVLARDRRSAS